MCNEFTSVGLSQDRRSGVDAVGSTAAHELGHIFNMDHDDDPQSKLVDALIVISDQCHAPLSIQGPACATIRLILVSWRPFPASLPPLSGVTVVALISLVDLPTLIWTVVSLMSLP